MNCILHRNRIVHPEYQKLVRLLLLYSLAIKTKNNTDACQYLKRVMLLVQFPEYILLIVTGKGESQQKNWFEQLGNDARYMWFLQLKCGISLRTNSSLPYYAFGWDFLPIYISMKFIKFNMISI